MGTNCSVCFAGNNNSKEIGGNLEDLRDKDLSAASVQTGKFNSKFKKNNKSNKNMP
jgi:hypothetical protein